MLAFHFAEGNDSQRAARYALMAGDQAAKLAAWREAVGFYRQALEPATGDARRAILMKLGEAQFQTNDAVQASTSYAEALALAEALAPDGSPELDAARLALADTLLFQGRYSEILPLVTQVLASRQPHSSAHAELTWGTALSLEGADLAGARAHLDHAEELLASQGDRAEPAMRAAVSFEQGSIAAQQGDLPQAIARYRIALAAAEKLRGDEQRPWRVLAYNNLGYHLLLRGDPAALEYAEEGMRVAQEQGILTIQPYLYSTLGEIALAGDDLATAEQRFAAGLELAERLSIQERVAGLTANLGLVALRRGQPEDAREHLTTALSLADSLGTQHLAAQIRLWLVPLLSGEEAHSRLAEARAIAEAGGRLRLLQEVERLEGEISARERSRQLAVE
jgi:hypothetical protein